MQITGREKGAGLSSSYHAYAEATAGKPEGQQGRGEFGRIRTGGYAALDPPYFSFVETGITGTLNGHQLLMLSAISFQQAGACSPVKTPLILHESTD